MKSHTFCKEKKRNVKWDLTATFIGYRTMAAVVGDGFLSPATRQGLHSPCCVCSQNKTIASRLYEATLFL